MLSNTTLEDINQIRYGLQLRQQFKTYKVRYALAVAEVFMSKIPHAYQSVIKKYVAKNGFVIIAIVDHRNSMIWQYAETAKNYARKAKTEGVGQLTLKFIGSHKDPNGCDVFTYLRPNRH
jgi:hypothetical protein